MKAAVFVIALFGTMLVVPPATAHDMVFPVDNYYLVVNAEDGYAEIWEEGNDVEGLQKTCDDGGHHDGPEPICHHPDTLIAHLP